MFIYHYAAINIYIYWLYKGVQKKNLFYASTRCIKSPGTCTLPYVEQSIIMVEYKQMSNQYFYTVVKFSLSIFVDIGYFPYIHDYCRHVTANSCKVSVCINKYSTISVFGIISWNSS